MSMIREIYEGFQRGEFDRWDDLIASDVILDSPALVDSVQGLNALKNWAGEFLKALKPRIDLVDEFEGDGHRAFFTITINWKHVEPFFDIKPTGREGTSVEAIVLTIKDGKVVYWYVAAASVDLAVYMWERGWTSGHNKQPKPIKLGIERR